MATFVDPRVLKPITDRLTGEALEAINAALDAVAAIPSAPETGTFHLVSTDGVLSWEVVE